MQETRVGLFWLTQDHAQANRRTLADIRGLIGSIENGFWVEVSGIPGPRMRGTGAPLIFGLEISGDRGHPPFPSSPVKAGLMLKIET